MKALSFLKPSHPLRKNKTIFFMLALLSFSSCNKTADKPKPPAPVFTGTITYHNGQSPANYTGLSNSLIHFTSRNLWVLQSHATFDTSQAALLSHPAFNFSIYASLVIGEYTFAPAGSSANGGFYATGSPGVDYIFQPVAPYSNIGGDIEIKKYDSGMVSGDFYGVGISQALDPNDEVLVNGDFSNIAVVNR